MADKKNNLRGRPSIFTQKLGEKICERIARGESLRKICKDKKMPSRKTIHLWLLDEEKKEFLYQYETASNIRADELFDELEDIADNKKGEVQRDRLRVDTRKWYLSKVLPKKFGDKMDFTSDGKPLSIQISKEIADKNELDTGANNNSEG